MSVINLSPEAVELVNRLCDPLDLQENIDMLEEAEAKLQRQGYDASDKEEGYILYDTAYSIKLYVLDLKKLLKLVSNGNKGIQPASE